MMSPSQSLYTLARRYCIERSEKAEFLSWEALDRILCEVERLDYDTLPALDDLKNCLLDIARQLSILPNITPEEPDNAFELQQECKLFRDYIRSVEDNDFGPVPPLPYRRVLSGEEIQTLRERIALRVEGIPLSSVHRDWDPFVATLGNDGLRELFIQNNITRFYELQKSPRHSYLLDINLWDPEWAPAEIDWTSNNVDWAICLDRFNFRVFGWIADLMTSGRADNSITQGSLGEFRKSANCMEDRDEEGNHSIHPPIQTREYTQPNYQTYGVFPDIFDDDRKDFWRLIHWCLEKGANEFIPVEGGFDIPATPEYLTYFASRFRKFRQPLKKRESYLDGSAEWILSYNLTMESLDLLKRIFPDDNLVLYRHGEVMLFMLPVSPEGHIILLEDEVEEFKTLGISFGEPPPL